jgi:hypothetical protein
MTIETMKLALEALETADEVGFWELQKNAVIALRTAIETAEKQEPTGKQSLQVKQKPVAWMYGCVGRGRMYAEELDDPAGWQPLYTTPPAAQRQWVGLTDEEIFSVLGNLQRKYNGPPTEDSRVVFALAIEAKLKEKNT